MTYAAAPPAARPLGAGLRRLDPPVRADRHVSDLSHRRPTDIPVGRATIITTSTAKTITFWKVDEMYAAVNDSANPTSIPPSIAPGMLRSRR